ncbi:NACHT domain-containing protein [Variovorax sp. R-27]|uniref:NACHT domain-containing protein n=1 Tax=Variovorax sp. R-27 TaxID=3404058 RepID=UPI003CF48C98
MIITATAIASTAKLLQPVINDLYSGAKKAGIRGLQRWDQQKFPQKLAKRLRSLEQVKTLWKPDGGVSLLDFYHPPKLALKDRPQLVHRLAEIGIENLVIQGMVGQGKSILLRSLAVNEILSNSMTRLPVFFELRTLSPKLSFTDALYKQLEALDIDVDEDSLSYLFRSNKISLLLDGFDEIEESLVKDTLREIELLAQKYPELQVIITSRQGHEVQKSPTFRVINIAPLTQAEFAAFLDRLKVSTEKSQAIRQAIKTSPSKVANLISTPLMLTLVVIVYESDSEIPETLPEFFERLFQIVFTRHDRMKASFHRKHYSGLSERRLQELFSSFCFMTMQLGHKRSLSTQQFNEAFDMALSYTEDCECEADSFRKDITKVACLMLEEGLGDTTFLHKSILEYYAASFVKSLSEDNAKRFYDEAAQDNVNWEEVLTFLKSIDPFRYSRDFILPAVQHHRQHIIEPLLEAKDDAAFISIMLKVYPGFSVHYTRQAEPPSMLVAGFGRSGKSFASNVGNFDHLVMNALQETLPSLSIEEFIEQFGPMDMDSTILSKGIQYSLLATKYGTKTVRGAVEIFAARLDLLAKAASKVVEAQEKKKLIFEKKAAT